MSLLVKRFFLQAVDPIHTGTGGYSLGRTDNSIIREPTTGIPKLPGTSLSGAARHYAAGLLAQNSNHPICAGQGDIQDPHCGRCPVCYTFGYTLSEANNYAGTVNIFDAQILLFPTRSMYGPIFITTKDRLEADGIQISVNGSPPFSVRSEWDGKQINIGWQLIQTLGHGTIAGDDFRRFPQRVQERTIVVAEDDFGMIVNGNLEIRTSVAINPKTGTAQEHALFTYEAIPRDTIFAMEVVEDNYRTDMKNYFPAQKNGTSWWERPIEVFEAGLREVAKRGIGGMGTRGFGRFTVINEPEEVVADES